MHSWLQARCWIAGLQDARFAGAYCNCQSDLTAQAYQLAPQQETREVAKHVSHELGKLSSNASPAGNSHSKGSAAGSMYSKPISSRAECGKRHIVCHKAVASCALPHAMRTLFMPAARGSQWLLSRASREQDSSQQRLGTLQGLVLGAPSHLSRSLQAACSGHPTCVRHELSRAVNVPANASCQSLAAQTPGWAACTVAGAGARMPR